MLQGHEDADAAGRGIDRADERDEQHDRVGAGHREGETGRDHQAGRRDQQLALIDPRAEKADGQRHQRRAEQRQGRDQCRSRRRRAPSPSDRPAAARRRSRRRNRATRAPHTDTWQGLPCATCPRSSISSRRCIGTYIQNGFAASLIAASTRDADVREEMIVEVPQGPALPLPFDPAVNPARHLPGRPPHYVRGARQLGGAPARADVVGAVVQGVRHPSSSCRMLVLVPTGCCRRQAVRPQSIVSLACPRISHDVGTPRREGAANNKIGPLCIQSNCEQQVGVGTGLRRRTSTLDGAASPCGRYCGRRSRILWLSRVRRVPTGKVVRLPMVPSCIAFIAALP